MTKIALPVALLVITAVYVFYPGSPHKPFEMESETNVGLRGPGTTAGSPVYATLDTEPAPVLSPREALDAFRLAPEFEIELVAAEPLVAEPVAMAWDEYGRLYVVEMRGYMRDAYGRGSDASVGQVVRLRDTDGDGRMDRSEVFLGGLVNPRAVAVVNEGVLIGEPPHLWLCELPRRDALCANPRRVGNYGDEVNAVAMDTADMDTADVDAADMDTADMDTADVDTVDVDMAEAQAANVEHMENGLSPGLDNWLYNARSDRQLRLVDGQLQVRRGLFRGQWGIGKDDYGRWFYNHNSTWLQADLFQGEDLVAGGMPGRFEGLGVNLTEPAEVFSVRVNPGVNRAYLDGTLRDDGRLHRATGVSGLAVYRGDQFPDDYSGDVFVPEVAGNVVARLTLTERGMELRAGQQLYPDAQWGKRAFLGSTDERFRPVDAMNGPDGALYIIDMYRGIIQDDYFLSEQLREQIFQRGLDSPLGLGRIWRVRHRDGDPGRAPVLLGDAGETELVTALSHANGWVRDTAQRLLLDRGGALTDALEAVARGERTVPALHAVWTLAGRGELRRDLVMQLAARPDRHRQVQALRAGSALLGADDLLALARELSGAPEAVRVQLAFAMGGHSDDARVRGALVGFVDAESQSVYLRQAVVRAVRERELRFLRELFAGDRPQVAGEGNAALIRALAANAYRGLRGDVSSDQPAAPALRKLLALAASRDGDRAWQQVAMLEGFADVTADRDFVPASLAGAPPIFSDGSVGEASPLWSARLSGRRAFTWPGDVVAMGLQPLGPEQLRLVAKGKVFYSQCAACHGEQGAGIEGLAPPLAGASWVTGPPEWLGRIVLQGMTGPVEVKGELFEGLMPPHGDMPELDDATLAGLMTFLRRSWGNRAATVGVDEVAAIRRASSERRAPWTADELEKVPYDRGFARFEGKYSLSFVTLTIEERPAGLFVSAPLYGGAVLERLGEYVFRASRAGESLKLEFVASGDGRVDSMILHRNGEKLNFSRKE